MQNKKMTALGKNEREINKSHINSDGRSNEPFRSITTSAAGRGRSSEPERVQ